MTTPGVLVDRDLKKLLKTGGISQNTQIINIRARIKLSIKTRGISQNITVINIWVKNKLSIRTRGISQNITMEWRMVYIKSAFYMNHPAHPMVMEDSNPPSPIIIWLDFLPHISFIFLII